MPEAEDVITDVARHATIYARELWRRHRKQDPGPPFLFLQDIVERLDLLASAVFGTSFPIRVAQPPAPASFLVKVFKRKEGPRQRDAVPATDGYHVWLPAWLPAENRETALACYKAMALQQSMRAARQSAAFCFALETELQRAIFTILEAHAADLALLAQLPGMRPALAVLRETALRQRLPLSAFPRFRRPLEELLRAILSGPLTNDSPATPEQLQAEARQLAAGWAGSGLIGEMQGNFLLKDVWTGEFRLPPPRRAALAGDSEAEEDARQPAPRSARLARRPDVREPKDDEDDARQGAWMVQTSQPHEQVEDPIGMQRPTDRDESTAAEDFSDALSELPEARLVSTPGRPKEVLLSDDAPEARATQAALRQATDRARLYYPEWDYRAHAYRQPGAAVRLVECAEGPQDWVDSTLEAHRGILQLVRRRFEMLRTRRVRYRKQLEGDDIDLDAYVDSRADFRAGLPLSQAVYQRDHTAARDMAIVLLIDISGSTDGWISRNKRVIDVEREALLLVSIALQSMAEPFCLQAFSGEGPDGVVVYTLKDFTEPCNDEVARRIAALEPQHYTRTGAALRHATAALMQRPARHRLLLLLSDGKPNDIDDYEGRYGVEDMRQAVNEARLQGIQTFCLTIDRQGAAYLPGVFGAHQYALLHEPESLPTALLEWMKRLVAA